MYFKFNFISFISILYIYLAILKPSKYRTLGYRPTGVKIVDLKGNKPSLINMTIRVFLLLIDPFESIIDIIWLTSEVTKQTLRDKYVGTYVVSLDSNPVGVGKLQRVSLDFLGWHLTFKEVEGSKIKE